MEGGVDEHLVDDLHDDTVVATPSATEIVIKGAMIAAGIVGFLGYVRWFESADVAAGYRIGSAGFAVMFLMLVIWEIASGQVRHRRSWRLLWYVVGMAAFVSSAVTGPL